VRVDELRQRAISSSTSRLPRGDAATTSSRWFSAVRCRASSRTEVTVSEPVAEPLQDLGKQPRRARRLDAGVRRILGRTENVSAIGEERGLARAQEEPPQVELREMGDELRRRVPLVAPLLRSTRRPTSGKDW
jgi:hypothetical protein